MHKHKKNLPNKIATWNTCYLEPYTRDQHIQKGAMLISEGSSKDSDWSSLSLKATHRDRLVENPDE